MTDNPSNPRNRIKRFCQICNVEFELTPSQIRNGEGTYCSRECHHIGMSQITGKDHPLYHRIELTCEFCGTPYMCKPSEIEKSRFCSRHCQGAWVVQAFHTRPTSIEIAVRNILRDIDVKFQEQKPMGKFLCDFVLRESRLVIECDGVYWHSSEKQQLKDARKDSWLISHGYTVLRLRGDEIREHPDSCKDKIVHMLKIEQLSFDW